MATESTCFWLAGQQFNHTAKEHETADNLTVLMMLTKG